MSNSIFPSIAGLTWDKTKNPKFKTKIQEALSGREVRTASRLYPIYSFAVSYEFLRDTLALPELDTLMGFFLQRQGSFDSFLYNDIDDNGVTDQVFGTGNGVTTKFQLIRTLGGFSEPVQNVNVLTNIKKAGVAQTNPTNYTIDATGLVTFAVAPAAAASLTWTGTYYYRLRFSNDESEFNQFMSQLWELGTLEMMGSLSNKI